MLKCYLVRENCYEKRWTIRLLSVLYTTKSKASTHMYSQPTPVLWSYTQCQNLTKLPIVASDQTGVHTTPAAPDRCLINHTNRACGASACSARVPPARAHEDLLRKAKSRGMWAYGTGLSFESGTRRTLSVASNRRRR